MGLAASITPHTWAPILLVAASTDALLALPCDTDVSLLKKSVMPWRSGVRRLFIWNWLSLLSSTTVNEFWGQEGVLQDAGFFFFFFPFLSRLSDYQQLGTDSAVVLQACSKQGETYSEARTLASKSPQSSALAMEQWAACSRGQRCLSKRFWKKTAQSVPVLPFNVGVVLCKRFPGGLHGGTGRAYFPSNMEEMGWSVVFDYSLSCIKENMSLLRIVF